MGTTIGDIIEVKLSHGFAYGQWTHEIPNSSIVQFFNGTFMERPALTEIVSLPLRFYILFAVRGAVSKQFVKKIGSTPIREDMKLLPLFRRRYPSFDDIHEDRWGLWRGQDLGIVENPPPEFKGLPILQYWPLPDLVERLESSNDEEFWK